MSRINKIESAIFISLVYSLFRKDTSIFVFIRIKMDKTDKKKMDKWIMMVQCFQLRFSGRVCYISYLTPVFGQIGLSKQCRFRSDAAERGV